MSAVVDSSVCMAVDKSVYVVVDSSGVWLLTSVCLVDRSVSVVVDSGVCHC